MPSNVESPEEQDCYSMLLAATQTRPPLLLPSSWLHSVTPLKTSLGGGGVLAKANAPTSL